MVPFEKQHVTIVRPSKENVTYEPPLRVGFAISDETVWNPQACMGRTLIPPGAKPNPTHYHPDNDVCWYIMSGRVALWHARSDGSDRKDVMLEAGDFVYIPAGAIHVIANGSQDEEASLIFCKLGVPNTDAENTVWLD